MTGSPRALGLAVAGAVLVLGSLGIGGLLLVDHFEKKCVKDAQHKMEPMRREFGRYLSGLPLQTYGVATDCDSWDMNAHLVADLDPKVSLEQVESRFQNPTWVKRKAPGGRDYYALQKEPSKMEVYVSWDTLTDPPQVIVTVYPR